MHLPAPEVHQRSLVAHSCCARLRLLARRLVVVLKPPASSRDSLRKRRELEFGVEALELVVGGGLLVLPVALLRVELDRPGELHAVDHRHGRVLDGHLVRVTVRVAVRVTVGVGVGVGVLVRVRAKVRAAARVRVGVRVRVMAVLPRLRPIWLSSGGSL